METKKIKWKKVDFNSWETIDGKIGIEIKNVGHKGDWLVVKYLFNDEGVCDNPIILDKDLYREEAHKLARKIMRENN